MNNAKPSLSVVVPTGKDDLRLRWCLEGLARQTLRDFETIIVNDGGPNRDATAAVVRAVRTRLPFKHTTRLLFLEPVTSDYRVCAARNLGAQHARADLIIFLDNDCIADPNITEDFANAFLRRQNRKELYYCQRRRLPIPKVKPYAGTLFYPQILLDVDPRKFHPANFYTFCVGVPREPFLACGGFDLGYHNFGGEDWDLKTRLAQWGYVTVDISTPDGAHGWVTHLEHEVKNWHAADFDSDFFRELKARTTVVRNGGPLASLVK